LLLAANNAAIAMTFSRYSLLPIYSIGGVSMQTKVTSDEQIAKVLAGDALLAFRRLADGGMVVVAANGMKLRFSAEKVREAEARLSVSEGWQPGAGPRRAKCTKQQP
jgi:hypothetical protein